MPRDPLAWLPLLRHWTRCLGEGGEAIGRLGDLSALPDLDLAALLPGGPGWTDVQRSLQHDPEGAFRLLYYGLALRGLESLPAPELLVPEHSEEPPLISVLIPVHNHWAITLNALRSLVAMANGTRFEVIVADDASRDATTQRLSQLRHSKVALRSQRPPVQNRPLCEDLMIPSEKLVAAYELHDSYDSIAFFQPKSPEAPEMSRLVGDCVTMPRSLVTLAQFTIEHIMPDTVLVQILDRRKSMIGNGPLGSNRALPWDHERVYGSIEALKTKIIYLVEVLTGFSHWLRHQIEHERIPCSEYLVDAEASFKDIAHQEIYAATLISCNLNLVPRNELFEHVKTLGIAFSKIAKALKAGGQLAATNPQAFGQSENFNKAEFDSTTGGTWTAREAELNGGPCNASARSQSYRTPGWSTLERPKLAKFQQSRMHKVARWKNDRLSPSLLRTYLKEVQT